MDVGWLVTKDISRFSWIRSNRGEEMGISLVASRRRRKIWKAYKFGWTRRQGGISRSIHYSSIERSAIANQSSIHLVIDVSVNHAMHARASYRDSATVH